MDTIFDPAIAAILGGDANALAALLVGDDDLATRRSATGHPTLLQMVACDAETLPDPLGSARVLIDAGAPMEAPLVAAAGSDSRDVVDYLLDEGADVDGDGLWTPLDEALYWRRTDITRKLLDRGAVPRTLRAVAGLGRTEQVAAFFEDGHLLEEAGPILSPFPDTLPAERANSPQDIIDNGFVTAVKNGHRETTAFLLDRGAAINAVPPGFHWKGTALHAAIWHGEKELVLWLLDSGADPTIKDGLAKSDAAGWANHYGYPEILTDGD